MGTVDLSDKVSFAEVTENLEGPSLDVVLESPGGSPHAAESIVKQLRSRFSDIRFIIPNVAKSAATMLALSGNMLAMDEKSELGPTDPQMVLQRGGMQFLAPATAILDQFSTASKQVNEDPSTLPAWLPILEQYAPSLLKECEYAIDLSRRLVSDWLRDYMLAQEDDASDKADRIAAALGDTREHKSHGRRIGIDEARALGLKVYDLRRDPGLQARVWALYCAVLHTFNGTGAFKIVENHLGVCIARSHHELGFKLVMPQERPA